MSQPIRLIRKTVWSDIFLNRICFGFGWKFFLVGSFFLVGTIWDQEKGSRGKRFPYYFNWEPFSFLIEIFYNSPNKFEKHQCEHIIRGFGFIMYHYAVHMCL